LARDKWFTGTSAYEGHAQAKYWVFANGPIQILAKVPATCWFFLPHYEMTLENKKPAVAIARAGFEVV
jgi:hypothetical protein